MNKIKYPPKQWRTTKQHFKNLMGGYQIWCFSRSPRHTLLVTHPHLRWATGHLGPVVFTLKLPGPFVVALDILLQGLQARASQPKLFLRLLLRGSWSFNSWATISPAAAVTILCDEHICVGPQGKTETMCAFVQSLQNLERQKKKKEGRREGSWLYLQQVSILFSWLQSCCKVCLFVFLFLFFGFPFLLFDVGSSLLWLRNNVLSLLKKDN